MFGVIIINSRRWFDAFRLSNMLKWLSIRNQVSSDSAVGSAPVIVTLTSHGKRIERVWYTLESIARGSVRPKRIIVWLDASMEKMRLRPELRRLQNRGVEFRFVKDIGPHQKYFYALDEAIECELSLVTADDDTIYWGWWLERLVEAARDTPSTIICYRARQFCLAENGQPAPYSEWPFTTVDTPRPDVFFTGVSGIIYPLEFVEYLKRSGTRFLEVCPKADDIWLNFVANRTSTPARQVYPEPWGFPVVPDTQGIALWENNSIGGNDEQIRATYDAEALARIAKER